MPPGKGHIRHSLPAWTHAFLLFLAYYNFPYFATSLAIFKYILIIMIILIMLIIIVILRVYILQITEEQNWPLFNWNSARTADWPSITPGKSVHQWFWTLPILTGKFSNASLWFSQVLTWWMLDWFCCFFYEKQLLDAHSQKISFFFYSVVEASLSLFTNMNFKNTRLHRPLWAAGGGWPKWRQREGSLITSSIVLCSSQAECAAPHKLEWVRL